MNSSQKPRGLATISSEALVGIGITVAWLGLMCLLLGWAEYMRAVPKMAVIWLALGAVLFVLGGLAALSAKSKDRRPIDVDHAPQPAASPIETESEPEEQRF
jgi:hypothetical protein